MTASIHPTLLPTVPLAVSIVPQAPPGSPVCVTGVHPAAALFPLMHGTELVLLVEDIATNGLREPIVLHEGLVLDGRNRLHACELARVEPRFVEWEPDGSPVAFVLSRNLHRRHLDESQRSIIAARAKPMFQKEAAEREQAHQFGRRGKNNSVEGEEGQKPRENTASANLQTPRGIDVRAASLLNVSARSVASASRVLADGDEQLIGAVDAGQVAVSDAATVVELSKAEQRLALDAVRTGKARTLRQAVESARSGATDPDLDDEPPPSPRQVRRVFKRFAEMQDRLVREVDRAALACGGPNDHTRRAREHLAQALRAMQECVNHYGRRTR